MESIPINQKVFIQAQTMEQTLSSSFVVTLIQLIKSNENNDIKFIKFIQ